VLPGNLKYSIVFYSILYGLFNVLILIYTVLRSLLKGLSL
jgi:hypothetical protein